MIVVIHVLHSLLTNQLTVKSGCRLLNSWSSQIAQS